MTGSSDGSVCLYSLETGKVVERLAQGGSLVYQVKLGAGKVVQKSRIKHLDWHMGLGKGRHSRAHFDA